MIVIKGEAFLGASYRKPLPNFQKEMFDFINDCRFQVMLGVGIFQAMLKIPVHRGFSKHRMASQKFKLLGNLSRPLYHGFASPNLQAKVYLPL